MVSKEDLRIGVVGFGGRGKLAKLAHRPGNGSRIVMVSDPDQGSLAKARDAFGSDTVLTSEFDEVPASGLDAVFLTSPDHLHEEQAIALLKAGIAVFLEKPMAITVEGADRILSAARSFGTPLYVGHNMRHMPFVVEMKRLVDSGVIGAVKTIWCQHFVGHGGEFFYCDWHAERRNINGLLIQKATHDIDVIHWLAGGYSRLVHGLGSLMVYGDIEHRQSYPGETPPWYDESQGRFLETWPPRELRHLHPVTDVEDVSMMQMRLDNGVLASYQQCNFTPDYWRSYVVVGDEGRLENFGNGEPGTHIKVWNRRKRGWDGTADHTFEVPRAEGGHHGADPVMVPEFLGYVRGESVPSTSPVSARWSVAAGVSATVSLRNGGIPVEVPVLDPEVADYFAASR